MLKNIFIYLFILAAAFAFSVMYYAWFSWFLLIVIICAPIVSLAVSLPFMILTAARGLECFCDDTVSNFDRLHIGVRTKNGRALLCPYLKIRFKTINSFASKRKSIVLKYGGLINKPVVTACDRLSQHCGCVDIRANFGKVYDFTGIFFLPIRLKFKGETVIMPIPQKPELLPDNQSAVILGYKPKPGGGFSDDYELREYRSGDSLKSVHWKLSSKYDELMVKAPSEAIYKKLVIKPEITDNPDTNDFVLARFIYVCSALLASGAKFYALDGRSGSVVKISSEAGIRLFLVSLYRGSAVQHQESLDEASIYNILTEGEEVSEG